MLTQIQTAAGYAVYKDHTIRSVVRKATSTEGLTIYMATALISWAMPDRRRRVMFPVTLEKAYSTAEEASKAVFEEARAWIDHHIEFEL